MNLVEPIFGHKTQSPHSRAIIKLTAHLCQTPQ
jgi:hypothetical protein